MEFEENNMLLSLDPSGIDICGNEKVTIASDGLVKIFNNTKSTNITSNSIEISGDNKIKLSDTGIDICDNFTISYQELSLLDGATSNIQQQITSNVLSAATNTELGGIKVGTNLSMTDGVLSSSTTAGDVLAVGAVMTTGEQTIDGNKHFSNLVGIGGTNSTTSQLYIKNDNTAIHVTQSDDTARDAIKLHKDDTDYYAGIGFKSSLNITTPNLPITFETASTERMKINNDGKIGINQSNPTHTLDIDGDINFTGTIKRGGTEFFGGFWSTTGNKLYYDTDNIGVGVTDPANRLSVQGPTTNATTATAAIKYGDDTGSQYLFASSTVGGILSSSGNGLYINQSNGNVGIGTTTFNEKLVVDGNGIFTGSLKINGNKEVPTKEYVDGEFTTTNANVTTNANNIATINTKGLWDKNGNKVYYNTDNIGIGTNDPATKLEVVGDISASGIIKSNGGKTVATQDYVDGKIDDIIGDPNLDTALDTLKEIADAINGDAGFGTMVQNKFNAIDTSFVNTETATSNNTTNITTNTSDISTLNTNVSTIQNKVGILNKTTKAFTVTVANKTSTHPYHGQGSGSGYLINGIESPELLFKVGTTYTFDVTDGTNSGHPFRFYLDANKTTEYTTDVTDAGTSNVSIQITETTPSKLYYQCSAHGYMGNYASIELERSDVTSQDVGQLSGATSNIQNQLDAIVSSQWTTNSSNNIHFADKVGIGTNDPTSKLEVAGDISGSGDIKGHTVTATNYRVGTRNIVDAGGGASFSSFEIKHNNHVGILADGEFGNMQMTGTLDVDTINEKTSANGVTIDNVLIKDGNIGSDTTSGNIQRHTVIAQNYKVGTRNIVDAGGGASFNSLEIKHNSHVGILADGEFGNMQMTGNLDVNGIINAKGNIGVSFENPTTKISLGNDNYDPNNVKDKMITFHDNENHYYSIGMAGETTNDAGVGIWSKVEPTKNNAALFVKNNGNIGVGNVAPTEKLDVTGNIKASGTISDGTGLLATTTYVDGKVAELVDSAPEQLNTLNELAAALNDTDDFGTVVNNKLSNIDSSINNINTTIANTVANNTVTLYRQNDMRVSHDKGNIKSMKTFVPDVDVDAQGNLNDDNAKNNANDDWATGQYIGVSGKYNISTGNYTGDATTTIHTGGSVNTHQYNKYYSNIQGGEWILIRRIPIGYDGGNSNYVKWFPSTDNARLTDDPYGTFVDDKMHNSAFGRKPLGHNFNGDDLIMFATGDDDANGRPLYYVVMKTSELDETESNGPKFVEERSINGVISTGINVNMYQGRAPAGGTGGGSEDPLVVVNNYGTSPNRSLYAENHMQNYANEANLGGLNVFIKSNSTDNPVTGTIPQTINYTGTWFDWEFFEKVKVKQLRLTGGQIGVDNAARSPGAFRIVASNDGTTWSPIADETIADANDYNTGTINGIQTWGFKETTITSQDAYNYYRLIVNKIVTGNNRDELVLSEVELIGSVVLDSNDASLNHISDVDTTSTPPTNGQALIWDNANLKWKPGNVANTTILNDLTDVNTSGATTNQALVYDGANWVPGNTTSTINDLTDVNTSGVAANNALIWNGTAWAPGLGGAFSKNGNKAYYNDGNVGIGIDNPISKLHVVGSENLSDGITITNQWNNNNQDTFLKLGITDATRAIIKAKTEPGDKVNLIFGTQAGTAIYNDVMTLLHNTNVGIGNSAPTEKLEVTGKVLAETAKIGAATQDANFASFCQKNNSGNNEYALIQTDTGSTRINAKDGQEIDFRIDNNIKMTVDSTGKVGIGTDAPTKNLEVAGDIKFTGDLYDAAGLFSGSRWTESGGNIYRSTGSVGIGINTPNTKLEVGGDLNLQATNDNWNTSVGKGLYMRFYGGTVNTGYIQSIDRSNSDTHYPLIYHASRHDFHDGSTINMRIDTNGNVGIGNTAPSEKLDVTGNIKASGSVEGDSIKIASLNTTSNHDKVLMINSSGEIDICNNVSSSGGGGGSVWESTSNNKIYYNTANVGIGTSDPTEKLQVNGKILAGSIKFTSLVAEAATGNASLATWEIDNSNVILSQTGNVGIGSATPAAKLDIDGGIKFAGHILPASNADYDIGSAEYKIRHLFLSDNSLWIGDQHKVDVKGGKIKFKKRKVGSVPSSITSAGGHFSGAKTFLGLGAGASESDVTLQQWLKYARTLDIGGGTGLAEIQHLYNDNAADFDEDNDANYVLPAATDSALGGVKQGSGVTIAADGTISAASQIWAESGGNISRASGNVGIGTTNSPSSKLHIFHDELGSSPPARSDLLQLDYKQSNLHTSVYGKWKMGIHNIVDSEKKGNLYITGNDITNSSSNYVDVMTISTHDGGRVGIGTTNPKEALDIKGNLHVEGDYICIRSDSNTDGNTGKPALYFSEDDYISGSSTTHNNSGNVRIVYDGDGQGGDNNFIAMQVRTGANEYNNSLLHCKVNGFVGIGNTAPTEKLDVTGNIKASGTLILGSEPTNSNHAATKNYVDSKPTTFVGLTDTPTSLTAGKYLAVNSGGSAIEFVDAQTGPTGATGPQGAAGGGGTVVVANSKGIRVTHDKGNIKEFTYPLEEVVGYGSDTSDARKPGGLTDDKGIYTFDSENIYHTTYQGNAVFNSSGDYIGFNGTVQSTSGYNAHWMQWEFISKVKISSIRVMGHSHNSSTLHKQSVPTNAKLFGSNDASTWVQIGNDLNETQQSEFFVGDTPKWKEFTINANKEYKYIRYAVSKVYGEYGSGKAYLVLSELEMFGDVIVERAGVTNVVKGQTLETIAGVCDGRVVEGESGTYTLPAVTQPQECADGSPWAELTGSKISYKPPSGAKQVIYKLHIHISGIEFGNYTNSHSFITSMRIKLDNNIITNFDYHEGSNIDSVIILTAIFDIGSEDNVSEAKLLSWNANKEIKIEVTGYPYAPRTTMYHSAQLRTDNGTATNGHEQTQTTIQVIKPRMEIAAIGEKTSVNSFIPHDGMSIQTKHKDYKKKVQKDNSGWDPIDNDLDTGFVVKIQPTSANSKVLINTNVHIGLNQTDDARWWGAKLYRKIGSGAWSEVTEANGDNSTTTLGGSASAHLGTTAWFSNTSGIETGSDENEKIANSGASFLDSPNTTDITYYTIYWASSIGNPVNASKLLYLNRAHTHNDEHKPSPMSSITASEIWSGGSPYIPPTDGVISVYNGNVGIGTTNPTALLEVGQNASGSNNTTTMIVAGGYAAAPRQMHFGGWDSGYDRTHARIQTSMNLHIDAPNGSHTYHNWYTSNAKTIIGGAGVEITNTLQCKSINLTGSTSRAFYRAGSWIKYAHLDGIGALGNPYRDGITRNWGIYCPAGDMFIEGYIYFSNHSHGSDIRIKKNIIETNDDDCLDILKTIKVYNFDYKDPLQSLSKNENKTFGYIADNLTEKLPGVVKEIPNFIPDHLQEIENPQFEKIDLENGSKWVLKIENIEFKEEEDTGRYKFKVTNDDDDKIHDVILTIEDDNKSFIFEKKWDNVFLYGKEVVNFKTVDGDQMTSLCHGAIKELSRKNDALQTENNELRSRLEALESAVLALQNNN